jgi:hypothetical protein
MEYGYNSIICFQEELSIHYPENVGTHVNEGLCDQAPTSIPSIGTML